jgi:hypothetical protein
MGKLQIADFILHIEQTELVLCRFPNLQYAICNPMPAQTWAWHPTRQIPLLPLGGVAIMVPVR